MVADRMPSSAESAEISATTALGREVIEAEAAALSRLSVTLDGNFGEAVASIVDTPGRVVVTGIGKSGHVARKIAATLASVGVPALYLHPAEAAHGDLGMLVPGDTVLMLSNSGATRELLPVVHHARANAIPVIAIGANRQGVLMERADIRLLLPDVDEAGPMKLAPTTSTAMMMALGDALAMAAMRVRGVSRDGFEAMTRCSFGIAGVCDRAGRLIGVITDGDLRRHADVLMVSSAGHVMTRSPVTIDAGELAEAALTLMKLQNVTALFVIENRTAGQPVGLVHVLDLLRAGVV